MLLFLSCGEKSNPTTTGSGVAGTYIYNDNNSYEKKVVLAADMTCTYVITQPGQAIQTSSGTYTLETYTSGNWVILAVTQNGQTINYDLKRSGNNLLDGTQVLVKQ